MYLLLLATILIACPGCVTQFCCVVISTTISNQTTHSITMKKQLLFITAVICFIGLGKANAQLKMQSGKTDMSFKIGAPLLQTGKFNDAVVDDFKASAPAIGIGFETGFFDNVSCGFEINYSTYKNDNTVVQPGGTVAHYTGDMTIFNVMVFAKYFTPIKLAKLATYARLDFLPLAAY